MYLPLLFVTLEIPDMNLILHELPRGPSPLGYLYLERESLLLDRFFFLDYQLIQHRAVSQLRHLSLVQIIVNHFE